MRTVYILLIIQFSGIVLCSVVYTVIQYLSRKKIYISGKYKKISKKENLEWLIDYFQEFPKSRLKYDFPESYRIAKAILKYKAINALKAKGKISERKYEKLLNDILPMIDIRSDLQVLAHE